MKSAARPILAAAQRRLYSAQAAQKLEQRLHLPKQDPKVSRLPSGAVVASVENYSPTSRVAVLFNAGSRYESGPNEGITHFLRNAALLSSTENATGFAIVRNIQQIGGNLSCTTTREHMVYSLECSRDTLDQGLPFLGHVVTSPVFKASWEYDTVKKQVQLDLAMLQEQPEAMAIEALHQAAYRNSLGRSVYMPAVRLGTHTPEMLQDFVYKHYTGANMAVVGIGVDHDHLVSLTNKHIGAAKNSGSSVTQESKAKYHGGEMRIGTSSSLTHACLVTEGASLDSKDLLTLGVLQKVMGSGPSIKYSNNMTASRVTQSAAQGTSSPFAASCININYSDSGLFGFYVVAQSKDMASVLKSVVGQFSAATKGGITEQEVQRAKNQLKASIAMDLESSNNALFELGNEALLAGRVYSADEVNQAVDKIMTADVQNIAKKVINGKPSMSAVGDLSFTPYLDELM